MVNPRFDLDRFIPPNLLSGVVIPRFDLDRLIPSSGSLVSVDNNCSSEEEALPLPDARGILDRDLKKKSRLSWVSLH